jgi:hypothetical protein
MSEAGYSGTTLAKKLGLKPGMRVMVCDEPANYWELVGHDLMDFRFGEKNRDFIHFFTEGQFMFRLFLPILAKLLKPDGMIWVSWPKKSSVVPSDMTEDVIRDVCLPMGLVDVKVCAVDETWSGLKLVWRVELRERD